jgi:hypothetical protein
MLDLNQVAIFVDVVKGGSFAAAARRWGAAKLCKPTCALARERFGQ